MIIAAAGIGLAAQVYNRLTADQPKTEQTSQPGTQQGTKPATKPALDPTDRLNSDVRAYLLGVQDGSAATAPGTARANSRGLGAYARSVPTGV